MDSAEYTSVEEEVKEEGFSLVWRPLVTRFSRDPEMVYWVPPLYSSHSHRSLQSLAQDIPNTSQSTTLERIRKYMYLADGQEEWPADPSRRESIGAAYVSETSLSSQDSHLYENIKGVLSSEKNPVSFISTNDSGVERDYFFYERENTPEEGFRHELSDPSTNGSDNQSSLNFCSTHTAHTGPFDDNSVYKSVCEDDAMKQSIRLRPSSSTSTPQNRNISPKKCKMAGSSGQTGRCAFNDDPEALHRLATCNLLSQASLRLERAGKVVESRDILSNLEQDSCGQFRHEHFTQDDNAYQLNKCVYILFVMLLLLGIVVIVVVVCARHKT